MEDRAQKHPIRDAIIRGMSYGTLLAAVFIGGYFFRGWLDNRYSTETSYGLLNEIEGYLDTYYLYDIPEDKALIQGAASGLVASLGERHTYYTEPESAELSSDDLAGEFGGIGAVLFIDEDGQCVIDAVYTGNPAEEAGLITGDIITHVDGEDISNGDFDIDGIVSMIRGQVGTKVILGILRGEETLTFELTRAKIELPSVYWAVSEIDEAIGIIQITTFTARTSEEVGKALDDLLDQGVKGIAIDLRNNGGGLLDSAVDVADHFLNREVILYEVENDGNEKTFHTSIGGKALDIPLVILMNEYTASASEILAGALSELDRASLVGTQSFGKGTVQVILDLSDDGTLRITNSEWFTPNRTKIEGVGLTPDVEIQYSEESDTQMEGAITALQVMIH